jgi:hypothetical protein
VLSYEWTYGEDKYKEEKQISIKLGDRLFNAVSTFWKNGELAVGLPIAIGLYTHEGKAKASHDESKGWMALWETIEDSDLGTGVVMDPAAIKEFKLIESPEKEKGHALFITQTDSKGQVSYYAGYGWKKAGEIKTSREWDAYLEKFAAKEIK